MGMSATTRATRWLLALVVLSAPFVAAPQTNAAVPAERYVRVRVVLGATPTKLYRAERAALGAKLSVTQLRVLRDPRSSAATRRAVARAQSSKRARALRRLGATASFAMATAVDRRMRVL